MLNFLLFIIVFVAIIFFTGNFRAIKLTMDCYSNSRRTVEHINKTVYTAKDMLEVRVNLVDWIGLIKLPAKKLKLTLFEKMCVRVYSLEFSRSCAELFTIIDWFVFPEDYKKSVMSWNASSISMYVKKLRAEFKHPDIKLTPIEEMYCVYRLNILVGSLVGVTELQAFVLKPIYKELFKDVDKSKIYLFKLDEIVKKFYPKTKSAKLKLRYQTSLTFKMIYFLHPQFSQNVRVKEFIGTDF